VAALGLVGRLTAGLFFDCFITSRPRTGSPLAATGSPAIGDEKKQNDMAAARSNWLDRPAPASNDRAETTSARSHSPRGNQTDSTSDVMIVENPRNEIEGSLSDVFGIGMINPSLPFRHWQAVSGRNRAEVFRHRALIGRGGCRRPAAIPRRDFMLGSPWATLLAMPSNIA
jgi:hypothetical protein